MTIRHRLIRLSALLFLAVGLVLGVGLSPAAAHEERPSEFPAGKGDVPRFLGLDNPRHRVVCQPESARLIRQMERGALKRRNLELLRECDFRSIQSAVNAITKRNTSIYLLPGTYHERRWANLERSEYCSNLKTDSDNPLEEVDYIGSIPAPENDREESDPVALSYADQLRCPHNLNLIAIFGDRTPENDSIACDSPWCGTQLVGTGPRRSSVLIDNEFAKLNAIRADRAGGVYLSNFTVQQAEFNAVYVMETDGFVLDRLVTRANDEYGILAFASDHGLIKRSNAYFNGDSGIYPGSASDINGDSDSFEVTRYSIEIRKNRSHHNTLGYSGTAGNSVWAHQNRFYKNAAGIATDSLFPDHPGLPQDHARWNDNLIWSNNVNYYERYVHTGACDKPMPERGYLDGVVCPVVPVPVGTGVLIAGGNFNSTDHNRIWDNWRYGTMQFWVPAALRNEYEPEKQYDTSHGNRTFRNVFGIAPGGEVLHNGMDHWWDDEGEGNCWEDNRSSRGEPTNNFSAPVPPCDEGGSVFTPGSAAVKDAGFLSCSQYDRNDPEWRDPPECNWFETPPKPSDSSGDPFPVAPGSPEALTDAGDGGSAAEALGLLAVLPLVGTGALLRRRFRGR